MKKKVLIFGGGTGVSYVLRSLKDFPIDITSVITVSDNGASTGKLRKEFLMPAMGDIRKVMTNLSDINKQIKDVMEYRYDTYTDLDGHPVGNLLMVAAYNMTGSLKKSIEILRDLLNIKHKVLPLSEDYLTLTGQTVDGDIIHGEEKIGHEKRKFKKLYYDKKITIDSDLIEEIGKADLIVFSIGSLYTSILPNLLSKDIIKAIDKSKAKLLYTCNAVGQLYETEDYTVSDHVKVLNKYLGKRKLDAVLAANTKLPDDIVTKYLKSEKKKLVKIDKAKIKEEKCELIERDLLIIEEESNYIRHDSLKLATEIFYYLMRK